MRIRKIDAAIIIFFILAAIIFYGINRYSNENSYDEKYIMIYSDNKLYRKILIADNTKTETIQIDSKYGKNTVKIVDGGVLMKDSDCPDKICLKSGFINKVGQSIICLPHKLVIEIKGINKADKTNKIDGISY